ncbi:MAG: Na(+)-translocating NADH-quinone reductase subunit C [Gammaproteobacteria bacterium]|uniref:Na(+)-translocating NADH-quinone reductase subunit C n=1 Tax=Marinobacter nitratireducens TaxID=1137280 RepID=A0A072N404_9GAMM|nr:Na(+)-translocating NADH-quinone reductase subunit C [Marinobacter nitratireducens]KEF31992.1 Na(+)-translocating NADH-quinone reductase subunit C [Marinobacter nitratireducens]TNE74885.1 MAG: Na(+)-translocating NADH-quinone reductase subunit C [Gammaproteobacteria bacterium]TNE93449.1 MAG: Na(+)-translocating NADH-quinone reductase subunit C [Gammaproteobacteria bacterium]
MAKAKETVSRTVIVALVLSVFFSVIVSTAAVSLKPLQVKNQTLNMKINILAAAGMLPDGASPTQVEDEFSKFEVLLVDLNSGQYVEPSAVNVEDPMKYDMYKAASDPQLSEAIPGDQDRASIKRRPDVARVFVLKNGDELQKVVLPIHGYGLWSTLYGFVSLKGDANTIEGLGFYQHAETPGLGGEVDNPRWKALWEGKVVYGDDMTKPEIQLVKGGVSPDAKDKEHKVDALSGATLTSRGVENLVNYWLSDSGYAQYLKNLRQGEA